MKRITSRQNQIVACCRDIARGNVAGLLLLDGPHLVAEALAARIPLQRAIVASEALKDAAVRSVVEQLGRNHVEVLTASAQVMDAVSPVRSSSAIIAVGQRPVYDDSRLFDGTSPLVVIATDVQDPGNLGAIVRVAEAGGATGVFAAGASADPFGWKALRGSMGSALRLPVARCEHPDQAIAQARRRGCFILATTPRDGRSLFDLALQRPLAVLIGSEGAGLAPSLLSAADQRVRIPMDGPVESLNAAVTAALVIYEARRQRGLSRRGDTETC